MPEFRRSGESKLSLAMSFGGYAMDGSAWWDAGQPTGHAILAKPNFLVRVKRILCGWNSLSEIAAMSLN
jgi:hypothetical protein